MGLTVICTGIATGALFPMHFHEIHSDAAKAVADVNAILYDLRDYAMLDVTALWSMPTAHVSLHRNDPFVYCQLVVYPTISDYIVNRIDYFNAFATLHRRRRLLARHLAGQLPFMPRVRPGVPRKAAVESDLRADVELAASVLEVQLTTIRDTLRKLAALVVIDESVFENDLERTQASFQAKAEEDLNQAIKE